MGVHGLTTYLRENKRQLSKTSVLSPNTPSSIPFVIDGWSFIYGVYNSSNLPWVYGGEHGEFSKFVTSIVNAWTSFGVSVYFVFDGPRPEPKFPTIISRLAQSHIQPAQLFFRTSPVSRSTTRFLNESRILPPLAYTTCVHTLEKLRATNDSLHIHFADEEGDPFAIELAARVGGYVLGNDSDLVIFNAEGYKGYVPLDEMVWHVSTTSKNDGEGDFDGDDDGEFQKVRRPKAKRRTVQTALHQNPGLFPPEDLDASTLSFSSYSPQSLAANLKIPLSLLPLFAALVGNDYSKESEASTRKTQSLFFERRSTTSQRIETAATAIRNVVNPPNASAHAKKKSKHQLGSVMDLIDRTVTSLLSRMIGTLASGEVEAIIENIVNAALSYAIPKYEGDPEDRHVLWPTGICPLHDPEVCPFLPMISQNVMRQSEESTPSVAGDDAHSSQASPVAPVVDPKLLEARELYLDAYRNGFLSPQVIDVLSTGSSWTRIFLENPDIETVGRSIGDPIRQWVFTIIDDTVGIPVSTTKDTAVAADSATPGDGTADSSVVEEDTDDSDQDELIDVIESNSEDESDFLAPLKGELKKLKRDGTMDDDDEEEDDDDDRASSVPPSVISHRNHRQGPSYVTQYLRKGTRVAEEKTLVRGISAAMEALGLAEYGEEDSPPLTLRPEEDRFTILLRIMKSDVESIRQLQPEELLPILSLRWVVSTLHERWRGTGSRDREKERWTKSEGRAFIAAFLSDPTDSVDEEGAENPPILDRNIQLTAQILMALDTIEQLSQVLLLPKRIPNSIQRFSGKRFHAYLAKTKTTPQVSAGVWSAVGDGLESAFQLEQQPKQKKARQTAKPVPVAGKGQKKVNAGSLFALLGDVDA